MLVKGTPDVYIGYQKKHQTTSIAMEKTTIAMEDVTTEQKQHDHVIPIHTNS